MNDIPSIDTRHRDETLYGFVFRGVRSAGSFTIGLQLLRYSANLVVSMCLARLIQPELFGLCGMAAVFLSMALITKDAGLEATQLARREIRELDQARLNTFSLVFGAGLSLVVALLAPLLVWLYDDSRLLGPCLAMSVCFVFHGLSLQPGIKLLREERFRTHAMIESASLILALLAALTLAWCGMGLWALFTVEIASSLFLLVGFVSVSGWRPSYRFDWYKAGSFLQDGFFLCLLRALGHTARNIDQLILGLFQGPMDCAFYGKAYRLMSLPQEAINWPLSRLAISALGKAGDRQALFIHEYKRFNLISATLGMPLILVFAISTPGIVHILYGPQWSEVVPLARVLGVLGFLNTFLLGPSWVYIARNSLKRQAPWEGLNLGLVATAFLVGAHWGAYGVAVAASASYALLRIPALAFCFAGTPLRLAHLASALARPLGASVLGAAFGITSHLFFSAKLGLLGSLALDTLCVSLGYILAWISMPGWRQALRDFAPLASEGERAA